MPADLRLSKDGREVASRDQPIAEVLRTGKAVPGFEGRMERPDGSSVDVMFSATPLFDEAGKIRGAIGALVDISRHKEAERSQQRLLHELQHRVKNIVATISALSSRMVQSSTSMEGFSASFLQRLQAMARTHELLSRNSWEGADLEGLLQTTVSHYRASDRQNLVFEGPRIRLGANAAATLGMIFFELASNAAKYGALANDKGRVDINWRLDPAELLSITWKERDGPAVKAPLRRNFGTTFIQQSLQYELDGKADLEFEESGLKCLLEIPLSRLAVSTH